MNVMVTGTSGTGKSTVAAELRSRNHLAIETDYDHDIAYWEHVLSGNRESMPLPYPTDWFATHHWKWDVVALQRALAVTSDRAFVCGDARNKHDAFALFDAMFVLHLEDELLIERLSTRTNNPFGSNPEEQAWALAESRSSVTELVAAGATVLDASQTPEQVVDQLLQQT